MSQPGGAWPTPPSRVPRPEPSRGADPYAGPPGPPPGRGPLTAPGQAKDEETKSPVRNLLEWVVIIAGALIVAFVVKTFLVQAFYIPSGSMLPTLEEGDRVLVNKLSYDLHDVNRGDIVVFEGPEQAEGQVKDLIKRVIGLPGETVEAHDGKVFIDGRELQEPYLGPGITTGPLEPQKVPPDHVFVMGDNRGNSKDSRYFGAIDESLIVGRAFVRVWPIMDFRFF